MQLCRDVLIILVVLTNLRLLGSSRLIACIRTVALQGMLLALLPLLVGAVPVSLRTVLEAVASGGIKGVLMPLLLRHAVRDVGIRRELEPLVGYTTSLAVGVALLGLALWLATRLPVPGAPGYSLLAPVALFTLLVGLFMIVARRKAVTQVVGYLAMENGIAAFGLAFARREPLLIELGILLDVFAAVFVMGIAIYHINREFDSIDTNLLSALKD